MIVPTSWKLPESITVRLGKTTYGRQRAIIEEGHVLLILHRPPDADDRARKGVLFWRNEKGEWHWSHGGTGEAPVKRHVQNYADLEQKWSEAYERAKDSATLFEILEEVTPLTRAARNMHTAIQTAREALKKDAFIIELRDQAYEIERNLELLVEDVRNALSYRTAREAEEQARQGKAAVEASHRLNMLAAMFFPLTALGSLFGMNLAHGLPEQKPWLFWAVFIVGLVLGFWMRRWVECKSK